MIFAQDIKHRTGAQVSVAAPPGIAAVLLPPLLTQFRIEQPDAVVYPVECSVEGLGEWALSGRADLEVALCPTTLRLAPLLRRAPGAPEAQAG